MADQNTLFLHVDQESVVPVSGRQIAISGIDEAPLQLPDDLLRLV